MAWDKKRTGTGHPPTYLISSKVIASGDGSAKSLKQLGTALSFTKADSVPFKAGDVISWKVGFNEDSSTIQVFTFWVVARSGTVALVGDSSMHWVEWRGDWAAKKPINFDKSVQLSRYVPPNATEDSSSATPESKRDRRGSTSRERQAADATAEAYVAEAYVAEAKKVTPAAQTWSGKWTVAGWTLQTTSSDAAMAVLKKVPKADLHSVDLNKQALPVAVKALQAFVGKGLTPNMLKAGGLPTVWYSAKAPGAFVLYFPAAGWAVLYHAAGAKVGGGGGQSEFVGGGGGEVSLEQGPPGSDVDEHGCIPSAGMSWSEEQQKCVQPWIEDGSWWSKYWGWVVGGGIVVAATAWWITRKKGRR